jgi:hypothetical protein
MYTEDVLEYFVKISLKIRRNDEFVWNPHNDLRKGLIMILRFAA